jgi:ankyrin repeat protein
MKKLLALVVVAAFTGVVGAQSRSPIADAAQAKDTASIRKLIKEGGDVNGAQGDGMTALHHAALNGDAELA